jgi:uncharacterized phage-associated protein
MALTSATALRRICELSKWRLSNLEANKLLYFAHMISLGRSGGKEPLVNELFQAWDYGPVLPGAYHHAKMFGSKPVKPFAFRSAGPLPEWDCVFDETLKIMGNLTSSQLVAESHWQDGAWARYYRPNSKGIEIPNGAILEEYKTRLA